jgi:hypothetical protein
MNLLRRAREKGSAYFLFLRYQVSPWGLVSMVNSGL